jgi:ketosteroid isomerase-like protein
MIDLKIVATEYFETFSRKDLDGLEEMFTDNVTLKDWVISASGVVGVISANKKIFESVETIQVSPLALYQDGNTVAAEIEVLINGEEKLLVVDVITFEGDKISSIRAYKG